MKRTKCQNGIQVDLWEEGVDGPVSGLVFGE